jgi:putative DNA primase/helicase
MSKTIDDIYTEEAAKLSKKITPIRNKPLKTYRGSEVIPKKIDWLFDQMFPLGEVSLIAGDGGVGKSTLLMKIAALISHGGFFDAGIFKLKIPQGNVVILSVEDRKETIVIPRIIAAGGNLNNVYIIEGEEETDHYGLTFEDIIRFDQDLSRLNKTLEDIGNIKLIIIDPISSYIGDINDYKNTDVKKMIAKLTAIARQHQAVVLLNHHLSKSSGNNSKASGRVMGSTAYTTSPRAVYVVERSDNSKNKREVAPLKNNYGNDKDGFAYEIESFQLENNISTTRINLLPDLICKTANDLLADEDARFEKTEVGRAKQFLFNLLKNGSKESSEIKKLAIAYDLNDMSLKRARIELMIIIEQSKADKRKTIWYLSNQSPDEIE